MTSEKAPYMIPLPYESKTWCVEAKSLNLRLLKIPCLQMCSHDSHEGHQVTPAGQARGLRKSGKSFIKHVVFNVQHAFKTAFNDHGFMMV